MGKETDKQVQETQRVPGRINSKRSTPRYIVIKLTKIKDDDKILKGTREKRRITDQGTPIRLSADFSTETLQARREWKDTFKVMKGKNLQPRTLYLARLPLRFDRETIIFPDKQKLKGASLGRKTRAGKDLQKINLKQLRTW